jgi:dTDP-4-amino-4,6-dideoxygalactose transaminase
MIPLIPTHCPSLGAEELAAVKQVFDSRWLGEGHSTRAFEAALREMLGVPHVVAVSSGTAALQLALEALDLPAGSGVLVPSLTFVASVQAILAARLVPVFCEVDAGTLQLELEDARRRCEPHVRAVMPVHFGGSSCDVASLVALAAEHGLQVVEDAAHAFGSSHGGRPLGTFGHAGCFSFDPIKNVTCGEGGAVATRSAVIAERVATLRTLGITSDAWSRHNGASPTAYEVRSHGWRYHLPNVNAAIGLVQLGRLASFRTRKQGIVARYDAAFAGIPQLDRLTRPDPATLPFTYTVRVPGERDALMAHLRRIGVGSAIEYIPNHLQPAFREYRASLPVTERLYSEILSLPLFVEMTDDQVERVIDAVTAFFRPGRAS